MAIMRMRVVAAMVPRYSKPWPPNTVRASCEMTVSASEGMAPMGRTRKLMPRKRLPRMPDIHKRVMAAFRLRGSRKAVMPLEMASTPVRAAVPLEKARRIRKGVRAMLAVISSGGGSTTVPKVPVR